jgi:hypothetical protein
MEVVRRFLDVDFQIERDLAGGIVLRVNRLSGKA